MFGDIGHGGCLLLVGLFLTLYGDRFPALSFAQPLRYIVLLMGIFATFAGLMYNDFMSMPLQLFKSCYHGSEPIPNCVYPVGLDHRWFLSHNDLAFNNSMKMKIAVILGVSQMSMGIVVKGLNAYYKKNMIDFVTEFIPQLLLMLALFGYMDILIISKWLTDWTGIEHMAPSIVTSMIDVCLNGGHVPKEMAPLMGTREGQQSLSVFLVIVAFICIPSMLIPKPLIEYMKMQKVHHIMQQSDQGVQLRDISKEEHMKSHDKKGLLDQADEGAIAQNQENEEARKIMKLVEGDDHETHAFTDVIIHQLIETIEFALGTISNTASYLRLWALSLAHSQLARVFMEMTVTSALKASSGTARTIGVFIGFVVWVNFTIGVLMLMDVMECFLHTLRLHWVEFQSKFYKGQGYSFKPLCFRREIFELV
jgi:V-type H+-transporting ATPase subunit a